jgi:hypothetical protein
MSSVDTITVVRNKFRTLLPVLDERMRRLWAANEARALGWGGIATVAEATGLSRTTICVGLKELDSSDLKPSNNFTGIRQPGAGRPGLDKIDGALRQNLESLLLTATQDDPDTPLHWTCKSTRQLAQALAQQGHQISHTTLATLIRELGYRLQGTRGSAAEKNQRDYDTKFHVIKEQVKAFTGSGSPVVAIETLRKMPNVDTHPKSKPAARILRPERVAADFAVSNRPICQPVWKKNHILHDKLAFAVECLERWWFRTGITLYPYNREMLVITDSSNGGGTTFRLWRKALQDMAQGADLQIVTCSLPSGAYKWRQLTHTMYCQIIENWPNRLQCSQDVFISLIGDSTGNTNANSFSSLLDNINHAAIPLNAEG